jgi:formate/nitrite transporter FocA (FNT family)
MFLFPFSMIMGGNFTVLDYLLWNELPVALGNLVGGLLFVGLPIYYTHAKASAKRELSK